MAVSMLAHWAGKDIFSLQPAALARRGIRLLLADLDNTLVPYGVPEPDERVRAWTAALRAEGITLFILSNNRHPQRAERFARALGVPFIGHAGKPKPGSFYRAMEEMGCTAEEIVCALVHAGCYMGFPSLFQALDAGKELLEER